MVPSRALNKCHLDFFFFFFKDSPESGMKGLPPFPDLICFLHWCPLSLTQLFCRAQVKPASLRSKSPGAETPWQNESLFHTWKSFSRTYPVTVGAPCRQGLASLMFGSWKFSWKCYYLSLSVKGHHPSWLPSFPGERTS